MSHTPNCDGWHYVGKHSGRTHDPEDDSIYCTGQCWATVARNLSITRGTHR